MFFILSKILSFLTQPSFWILLSFFLFITLRKRKIGKKVLVFAISLLILFTNPFLSTISFKAWEIEPTPLVILKNHDIAVVFSGMTISDKKPYDRIYFNKAADRIMMAVHLYKIGKVKKILISGGTGKLVGEAKKEAETLKDFLLMLDIPEEDIIQEKKADNTYQNALYTKELVDNKYKGASVLLITSAFHMRRSLGCCNKVNLECTPFAVDYHTISEINSFDDIFIPSSAALYNWDILFHELVGYLMYLVTGKI